MNTKEFISVMRKLIREEVRTAIREELREVKAVQPKTVRPKPNYNTGNRMIDDILSETVVTREFGNEGPAVYEDSFNFTSEDVSQESFGDMPFMKNYSALLKRADQISKDKH